MAPWVRLVVVNYNSGDLLAACVKCLAAQTDPEFEAVIVDNASPDGSVDRLTIPDNRFSVVRSKENLGFAAGCNLGLKGAETEWVGTLNPDAFPEPDWLDAMRKAISRYPEAAALGSLQIDASDPTRLDGCGDGYAFLGIAWRGGHGHRYVKPFPDGECFSPCAAAALYRRRAFETVGGFDEKFFCYCEDVDLGFRLRLRGGRCIQVGNAVVRHLGSAVTGQDSAFTLFHSARNRLWTLVKNMPAALICVALPLHVAAVAWILWRSRGTQRFRPMWRGLLAGIRGVRPILAERRQLQRRRTVSTWRVAEALTWNIGLVRRRAPDLRAR